MIDLINPYTLKIIISCRKEDSIRAISQRINVSYGWTYKWARALASAGVLRLTRMKVYLNEKSDFYKTIIDFIHTFTTKAQFYYEVLAILGIRYCFTATDAVYVWTRGGYNIGRYREYYPIFIKVRKEDKEIMEWYCRKLSLKVGQQQGIFYKITYVHELTFEYNDERPVDPLKETIAFMMKHKYNFQPALEMVQELYHKPLRSKYREAVTNV